MASVDAAHAAIERRRGRAVRSIMKLAERSVPRMDQQALLRCTVLEEVNAVAELAHSMINAVAGDDVVINEVYVEAVEPLDCCR